MRGGARAVEGSDRSVRSATTEEPEVCAGRGHVRHLYVHVPFCAHRCGYCDFVTAAGRRDQHAAYVDALLLELQQQQHLLRSDLETIFVGGGTPTFTEPHALERLLAALPQARELTVEANPETIGPEVVDILRRHEVTRVSLGAQSFQPHLLRVLERRATPEDVRRAAHTLHDVGFDNISLDLIYGIPGQKPAHLETDLVEALALAPEHLSCYELEAKPGTRFTRAYRAELELQADSMEGYFETVVDTLTGAGYRWYETANFCLDQTSVDGRDLRAQHNLGYWRGRDYLGIGVGAVSTVDRVRWTNRPALSRYLDATVRGDEPPRAVEQLDLATKERERVMLGLRLDEPLFLDGMEHAIDLSALTRMVAAGLVKRSAREAITLTRRGRFVGDAVTAELLAG